MKKLLMILSIMALANGAFAAQYNSACTDSCELQYQVCTEMYHDNPGPCGDQYYSCMEHCKITTSEKTDSNGMQNLNN